ncbi:MAG: hypothetical protein ACK5NA_05850 [Enterococcus sp.]
MYRLEVAKAKTRSNIIRNLYPRNKGNKKLNTVVDYATSNTRVENVKETRFFVYQQVEIQQYFACTMESKHHKYTLLNFLLNTESQAYREPDFFCTKKRQ